MSCGKHCSILPARVANHSPGYIIRLRRYTRKWQGTPARFDSKRLSHSCLQTLTSVYLRCYILPHFECIVSLIYSLFSINSSHISYTTKFLACCWIVHRKFCIAVFPFSSNVSRTTEKSHPSSKLPQMTMQPCPHYAHARKCTSIIFNFK